MKIRKIMALYRENKDLIDVGMYNRGSNPKLGTKLPYLVSVYDNDMKEFK